MQKTLKLLKVQLRQQYLQLSNLRLDNDDQTSVTDNAKLSDHVMIRLTIARHRAMQKYREIYT
jgi:hypothetical protein